MQTKLELYQKVTPLAHLGIWERNLCTGEIYWNEVVRDIFEVDQHFIPTLELLTGFYLDQASIIDLIQKAIESGDPESGEFQILSAKDKHKWVKVRIRAGFESGECQILYGTIEDITDQIKLVTRLAEREEQFHHAFEYAPIGMALVSPGGEWIRVNKMLCRILGYEKQEFLKQTFQDITHPDDLDIDLKQMYQLLGNKINAYNMDKRYYHKDGSIIWVSLNVTLVRDQQGDPSYFVSQIIDITERIKALEVISAQNNRLLNFAHIVSHNLRSHTANIQMLSDMVVGETDPNEKDELVNMLAISASNLQETLTHLNEVVDVHTGGRQKISCLNLNKEINKTVDTLSASLKQAGASLSINVDPKIEIQFDQAYLESVLLNLLTNGIKYRNPDKPLEINIQACEVCNKVVLKIQDNGLGIDLTLHGNNLFGMYKTFHGNKDARGIGLFLVKNHVESMGGSISVESCPKEGTTFKIEFKDNLAGIDVK
jgi:PAS domain S-box-containing protein